MRSVEKVNHGDNWTFQHDNDPKHNNSQVKESVMGNPRVAFSVSRFKSHEENWQDLKKMPLHESHQTSVSLCISIMEWLIPQHLSEKCFNNGELAKLSFEFRQKYLILEFQN